MNNLLSRSYQFRANGAARTIDLLVLPETKPANDGQYHFELREEEKYYSAFDAVELQVFEASHGAQLLARVDGQPVATRAKPQQATKVRTAEGSPGGSTTLSPASAIHASPGTVVEYEWTGLPASDGGVMIGETNIKIPPICGDPDLNCDDFIAGTGRPRGTGLLIEQWREGAWHFIGDLVPRISWEKIALELQENGEETLRIRVHWEGTHNFRMVGWVPSVEGVEPSDRLSPSEAHHGRLGDVEDAVLAADQDAALLGPGDTIALAFIAPKLAEDMGRQLAMRFVGRYSNNLEALGMAGAALMPEETTIAISGSNPFNPATTWEVDLTTAALVGLRVYDAEGRLVRKVVDNRLEAGAHTVRWDGRNEEGQVVPSGVYFWRFEGAGLSRAAKFVVLK